MGSWGNLFCFSNNRVRWVLACSPGIRHFITVHFESENIITLYHELYVNLYQIQALAWCTMDADVALDRERHIVICWDFHAFKAVGFAGTLSFYLFSTVMVCFFMFWLELNRSWVIFVSSFRYNAVVQSWQLAFNWEHGVNFQVRDVRARVLTDMAWVTMKTFVDIDSGPFNVTNIYEFHNGRWYMVHHHSSVMLMDAEVEQQLVHA